MRVLITRPRHDAETFATLLHARGHTTIIEPLIDIAFRDGPPLDLSGVGAIALTSANGGTKPFQNEPSAPVRRQQCQATMSGTPHLATTPAAS